MAGVGQSGTGLGRGDSSEGSHPSSGDEFGRSRSVAELRHEAWLEQWMGTHGSIRGRSSTVQALIAGSVLTHTRCLRSTASPWPLLPGTLCCPTKSCHQRVLLLSLSQPQRTEISLLQNYQTSQAPSTKLTLGCSHRAGQTTPPEGSDATRPASATGFQQGERRVTMSWSERRQLSVPQ